MATKRLIPVVAALAFAALLVVYLAQSRGSGERGSVAPSPATHTAQSAGDEPAEVDTPERLAPDEPAAVPRDERVAATPTEAPRSAAPADTGLVARGRVVDANGRPLGDARVQLRQAREGIADRIAPRAVQAEATTRSDGTFALTDLEPGRVVLSVRKSGYVPLDVRDVGLPDAKSHDFGDLSLALGAILEGRVVDDRGVGVAGARISSMEHEEVFFFGSNSREPLAVSDATGAFRIESMACGPWRLLAQSDEHPAGIFRGEANTPGAVERGIELRLGPAASITGRVLGIQGADRERVSVRALPAGGGPVLSDPDPEKRDGNLAEFAAGPRQASIGAGGEFELRGLHAGRKYRLELARHGQSHEFVIGGPPSSDAVVVDAGARGVELVYEPRGAVAFQVVAADTGVPIPSFTARTGGRFNRRTLNGPDGQPLTRHENGAARIEDLPTGRAMTLDVRATGYEDWQLDDLTLEGGEVRDLGRIRLARVPTLRVRALEDSTSKPIEGALVRVVKQPPPGDSERVEIDMEFAGEDEPPLMGGGRERRARTGPDGWATVNACPGELVTLHVESKRHAPHVQTDLEMSASDGDYEARLIQGGSAVVTVLGPDGTPSSGVRVDHRSTTDTGSERFLPDGFGHGGVQTDAAGRAHFEHLLPGEHGFRLADASGTSFTSAGGAEVSFRMNRPGGDFGAPDDDWTLVQVGDGETVAVELRAAATGGLGGRVREAGVPLAGASLSLTEVKEGGDPGFDMPGFLPSGPRAKTDGDGRYRFEDVKEGKWELRVSHPSRAMPSAFEVDVRQGSNAFDVELSINSISGRITDVEGKPLPGVRVRAERVQEGGVQRIVMAQVMVLDDGEEGGGAMISSGGEGRPETTDEDGRYTLRGLPADVDLVVSASGDSVQEGRSEVVNLAEGELRRGTDLELEPAGTIEVTVLNAQGKATPLVMVQAENEEVEGREPREITNRDGKAYLRGLRPGTWILTGQSFGGTPGNAPAVEVEVQAGVTATATLRLP